MYTTLFILIMVGTWLFYVSSDKVKLQQKPRWARKLAQKPALARAIGTAIFLISWAAVAYLQGLGSGTFAMVSYLMASYCLLILLKPLHYFNTVRLALVALVAFLLEIFIF